MKRIILFLTPTMIFVFLVFWGVSLPKHVNLDSQLQNYESSAEEQAQFGMPLVLLRSGRKGKNRRLAVLSDDWFYCHPPSRRVFKVPRGYVTDFASIPNIADLFLDQFGNHAEAAVLHDWLYAIGEPGRRKDADMLFLYSMKEQGVSTLTAEVMYRAVRIGGAKPYGHEREWRFFDLDTDVPALTSERPKPSSAQVTTLPCETLDSELNSLQEKYGTPLDN